MRVSLCSIVLILTSLMVTNLVGQGGFSFQKLSKKEGLSQASVFAISQDNTGIMWFGTRDGLNKYDGYQFKVYRSDSTENSIVGNDIRTLYFDRYTDRIWIGSHSGLAKYRSETDDFHQYLHDPENPKSISNNIIRQVHKDSHGRLWVGTSIGLNLLDESTHEFSRYYFDNSQALANAKNDVKAILEDQNGNLWFGTADGLYRLKTDKNGSFIFERESFGPSNSLSDSHIKNLLEDKKGNFWIGTFQGGINYWDRAEGKITVFENSKDNDKSLSHNNIRSMVLDTNQNLWVGTFDGLNYLELGSKEFTRFSKSANNTSGLSDKSIRSLFIDMRGSLWVGTYYGGINHSDKNYNRFKKQIPIGDGLAGKVVSSFAEDKNKNLWIGTEGDGLNYFDKKNKAFTKFKYTPGATNSLSGNNVKQLLLDDDKLWIGTFQAGLDLYNTKSGRFKNYKHDPENPNSISANNVYGIHKENNLLWILTYGGGLDILDLDQKQFYNFKQNVNDPNSLSSNLTRVLLQCQDGQLWIGTEKGLNNVTLGDDNLPESFEVLLPQEKIYCLAEDSQGFVWVGTFGNGFYRLEPVTNTWEHYTTQDGLPGSSVLGIIEVAKDELWISTNNGLSRFDNTSKQFTNYDFSNGLDNSEYNYNAYYKDSEGDLLFGGINGFTYFNPKAIQPNEFVPPLVFTELKKNNQTVEVNDPTGLLQKSINETESITFKYKEANFSIQYAALDYFSPKNNQYAFLLEGIDKEWNYSVGKREATYTIQKAGNYIFRLKGGNSEGMWNPNERQLRITVLPPPWKTWWAYVLYALMITALILGLLRFVRLRHNLQLEKIFNQQQAELHEVKLRFFTNITHEFRTPLTLIIAPLNDMLSKESFPPGITKQLMTVQRNAHRMLNLVNQILTFRKLSSDHMDLTVTQGDMVKFLQEIYLLFQESANSKDINYSFEATKQSIEAWFDHDKLEKVFFNLLSNAFKFTPSNENVAISISEDENNVEVLISDSGSGIDPSEADQIFKRFYEKTTDRQSTIKGTGIGLAISQQMIELHQGQIYLAKAEETKFDKGATFVIVIPKGKQHFDPSQVVEQNSEELEISKRTSVPTIVSSHEPSEQNIEAKQPSGTSKVLIVEDNEEVLEYIKDVITPHYQVITARNGLEGLSQAREHLPDLVISDVMMPEKDGISFCKELKSDFDISHIPVVLLTARAASMFKIEGLEIGADDYITKPFHPDELRLRVRNIIKARHQMRAKFKRAISLDPEEPGITPVDEQFIENAIKVVEKNIDSYEFNVNQFAHDLAVSRPQLFTKFKALTGQTPNNFIKSIRMKRAAQLLCSNNYNISEVAYKVGFKDVKYFSKCFKAQYDIAPSQYKQLELES